MIAALEALKRLADARRSELPASMAALGISGSTVKFLFSTHPPLDQRIAELQRAG
jgi:heat shock protein HtpX